MVPELVVTELLRVVEHFKKIIAQLLEELFCCLHQSQLATASFSLSREIVLGLCASYHGLNKLISAEGIPGVKLSVSFALIHTHRRQITTDEDSVHGSNIQIMI